MEEDDMNDLTMTVTGWVAVGFRATWWGPRERG